MGKYVTNLESTYSGFKEVAAEQEQEWQECQACVGMRKAALCSAM